MHKPLFGGRLDVKDMAKIWRLLSVGLNTHINTFSEFNHNTFVQMLSTFVFRCLLSHTNLFLSESNCKGMQVKEKQLYPDHLGRFDRQLQVHSKDSLTGRCYWEVEWGKRIWVETSVI